MKKAADDIANWRLQQENLSKPFPYVFPQMPSRFRRCRRFVRALFLIERGSIWLFVLGSVLALSLMLLRGRGALLENSIFLRPTAALFFVLLPLSVLCRLLRNTPKFFWHCPCCGQPFPYYAPPLRGLDELKEAECLHSMEYLHIKYVKTRFCPLILPSVCPECRCKFFEMADGFSARNE